MNKINSYFNKKATMSYIQIAILIIAMFAFGFFMNQGLVSAKGPGEVCCEVTDSGSSCQHELPENCDDNYRKIPSECESANFCKKGCCISPENGFCYKNAVERDCTKMGGEFLDDAACNVQECRKGCCVMGSRTLWTTESNCEWEGNTQGDIPTDFRLDLTSPECLFLQEAGSEGACVYDVNEEKKCVFTTREDCYKRTGSETNFYNEVLCSNQELDTICIEKDHKDCITGEEDSFWFDSCGNKEDVSDDCDFYSGTYCGKTEGRVKCEDIRCDTNGDGTKDRENGESWCAYDGFIGSGKDYVGSRHIMHICHMGKERISPCSDYRNEICVQEDSQLPNGKKFSQAACRVNQWRVCLEYNTLQDNAKMNEQCNNNVDCRLKNINMGASFNFGICLPNYPPGFDLTQEDLINPDGSLNMNSYSKTNSNEALCSIGSLECVEIWECTQLRKWWEEISGKGSACECTENCGCQTPSFTKEMNDLCVSLGDCGGHINYLGDYSPSYNLKVYGGGDSFKHPGLIKESDMKSYLGKKSILAKPGDFEFFQTFDKNQLQRVSKDKVNYDDLSAFEKELWDSAGGTGSQLLFSILKENIDEAEAVERGITLDEIGLSRYSNSIRSVESDIQSKISIPSSDVKDNSNLIGGLLAGADAVVLFLMGSNPLWAIPTYFIAKYLLAVDVEERHYNFQCLPFEPPTGGDKCNECNKLDVPCTEYRCESLGEKCRLINKGSESEICISKPEDKRLPEIEPFTTAISEGYEYDSISTDGFKVVGESDECIEPYTKIRIGIKTEPYAKCRYGFEPQESYEEMEEIFGLKGNQILPAHMLDLFFYSPDAFKNKYNLTEDEVRELGKVEMYVKCKTEDGSFNPEPFKIQTCINPGPDLTAPFVERTIPESNSYIKYGAETKNVSIYVNEPSECRWSLSPEESFDEMGEKMDCETDYIDYTIYGFLCTTKLTGLNENTKHYFKCKDLSENVMSENLVLDFKTSSSPLSIEGIVPVEDFEILSGTPIASTPLKLITSGGVDNGISECRWEGNGYEDYFNYDNEAGSNSHEYQLNSLSEGNYEIDFICSDVAGNVAENSTRFSVELDVYGPKIVRAYQDEELRIITESEAECKYSFNRNDNFEDSISMSGDEFHHYTDLQNKIYYIQCKDEFDNKNKIKVRPVR